MACQILETEETVLFEFCTIFRLHEPMSQRKCKQLFSVPGVLQEFRVDEHSTWSESTGHSRCTMAAGERHQLRSKLGIESEEELKSQFVAFANFGNHGEQCSEMDGARFCKYCQDCKVLGKGVTRTDVDLAFAKCKDKGARRVNFDQFLKALNLLASRRDLALDTLVARCIAFQGPVNHSSVRVGSVRLHDDKV